MLSFFVGRQMCEGRKIKRRQCQGQIRLLFNQRDDWIIQEQMQMSESTQYSQLLPLGDNSDDDEWDDEKLPKGGHSDDENEAHRPEVVIRDTDKLLRGHPLRNNGTAYNFSRKRKATDDSFCTPTRAAILFATVLLCSGAGYMAGFITQGFRAKTIPEPETSRHVIHKRTDNWRTKMPDWGTESCIRLVDVDGDGVDDVIIGLALGKDVTSMLTEESMGEFCRKNGMRLPCAGAIVALRGKDGKLLWKTDTYSEIFELLCHGIDVNQDGTDDCIATGRLADMRAIDPKTGELLWVADMKYLKRGWNIYAPAALPDLDEDGVRDIVIAHGGDPTVAAEIHERNPNRIILISGKTGKPIGRYMETPNSRETYMSPVIHERKDGSQYILLGTGGETVDGLFMAISIPDYFRLVKDLPHDHPVPNTRGSYSQWGFKAPHANGTIEIFKSDVKGVMVPPVLIDMNKDGVKDILMSSFNGYMILYDGETLEVMWKIKLEERESYSTPAPGYFNDDGVIDFMVHWSVGAWPFYNTTDTIVLDGRDGSILWNLTTNKYDVSSDLVLRTNSHNRDVFLFRAQGRHGRDLRNEGAIHGATGIQRIVRRRALEDGEWDFVDTEITERNANVAGTILPGSHFRSKRAVINKDYVECESDQTVFLAEVFAMDRTVMKNPIKLWERGSEKYFYKLTSEDRHLVQEVMKKYGANHTMTENEVPWSRGRRDVRKRAGNNTFCLLLQPDERTTGAIGDVDGDGRLDLIVNLVSVGVLRDEYARYVKMKFDVDIYKVNLEDAIMRERYVPVNVTLHDRVKWMNNENKITTLKFMPAKQQQWGGYMGTKGDSTYRSNE